MITIRKTISILTLISLVGAGLEAQALTTANALFTKLAEKYAQISDYRSTVSIVNEDQNDASRNQNMAGTLFWKKKSRLRIDFSNPWGSVLVSNGLLLQVYLQNLNIILTQKVDPDKANPTGLATNEGLTMMRRGYNIAFKSGPGLQPLEQGSAEMVYKLLLTSKNANQGFRQIDLSVTDGMIIRRIEGITYDNHRLVMNFSGISVNIGIGDSVFDFDPPAEANQYDGFLFGNNN